MALLYIYMIYDIYDALSFLEGKHNNEDAEQVQMISNDHCFRRILPNSFKFYPFGMRFIGIEVTKIGK